MSQPQPLRKFQEEELARKMEKDSFGLAWDMGLGKTVGVSTWVARKRLQRILVLCPDNAFSVWRDEAPKWILNSWPEATIKVQFVQGPQAYREEIWNTQYQFQPTSVLILICTPDSFIRDWGETITSGKKKKQVVLKARKEHQIPQVVIFDEAKRMRNPDSKIFQTLSRYLNYYHVAHFIPMTGTPGHTPKDFWTMLHCINPRQFRSYWQFVHTFHECVDGYFGMEILGPRNLPRWYDLLKTHFSVVKEDDEGIADQRPPMTRQLLPITMDNDQAKVYYELKDEMLSILEGESNDIIVAQNSFVLATRLRQLLVCPRILSDSLGVGAAIRDFADTVEPNGHNVIFCPFKAAFDHFTLYLQQCGFRNVHQLYGGMGSEARDQVLQRYREEAGTIICSTMYAQAFSLEPATKSFAIGYSWDPDDNRQAEKRLHRLTTQNPVTAYYYTFRSTFDERLCHILNIKQENVNLTIPANLRSLLAHADPIYAVSQA